MYDGFSCKKAEIVEERMLPLHVHGEQQPVISMQYPVHQRKARLALQGDHICKNRIMAVDAVIRLWYMVEN
jgi:hypothetical protein